MKKILLIFMLAAAAFSLDARKLTILHMNDTHSHIEPERNGEQAGRGGVIEQAAIVDSVRRADGRRNVLLLHAGDFSQGSSYFTILKGDLEISVLNAMGFEVGPLRAPLSEMSEANAAKMIRVMKDYGLKVTE